MPERVQVPPPNAVDRVVGYFNPAAGLRRAYARTQLAASIAYSGARRDRPATRMWSPFAGSPDADTLPSLPALRTRSRDALRNNPIAVSAFNAALTESVGIGIMPKSALDRDVLGMSEDEAQRWERRAERIFAIAASQLDVERRRSFARMQWLTLHSVLESGDLLVVRRNRRRPGDLLSTKVQLIEADRVSNPEGTLDTDRLVAGVEKDGDGAPIRFHVQQQHPGDIRMYAGEQSWVTVPAFGPKSGERLAWLVYQELRPGQTRGVPWLAPVIEPLKQLSDYGTSELHAAVVNSFFTMIVKSAMPEGGLPMPTTSPGDATERAQYKLGAGLVIEGDPLDEYTFVDPKRPNTSFEAFVLAWLRQIGAALGIPFELLVKHFSSSFSASQAAMLQAWRYFRTWTQWIVDDFCRPIWDLVITEAVSVGLLDAPGFLEDAVVRRAWLGTKWIGPGRGLVRPDVEVKASREAIDIGVSTIEDEAARLYGGDWEQLHEQRVREHRLRVAGGLEQDPPQPDPALPEPDPRRRIPPEIPEEDAA